ncbi:MAG: ergothioneine biosynthesis glutamate--cysteine ligase EgtA [Nocardioidaceae bacterium]|nr:ergothioneine biosynthesis glutamate--cysteine ligase EgtA [Nocardioidaceae bacterium]
MTVAAVSPAQDARQIDPRNPVESARHIIAAGSLHACDDRRVGLELEFHLVDLAHPGRRPSWVAVQSLLADLPEMPTGSSVTLEPGGQIELSTPPHPDLVACVTALRADREALRGALATAGFGAAPLGADPARPVRRTNPHQRYAAMEQHFEALGYPGPGRAMMSATAALQINVDAGPATGWSGRLAHLRALVPMLIAASATSPYLGGRSSGWHSMRQETWHGIDPGRSDPISSGDPAEAWADYALHAPVMLVAEHERLIPVTQRVTFGAWLRTPQLIGRAATRQDLDYHLTTLFPPVRPRGYVEIRCVDALPDRWWPAMAAVAVTLIDDPVAADAAAELCEPVAGQWEAAAQRGPGDPALRAAVTGCARLAARHCPAPLRAEVEAFAELVSEGRTPRSELNDRIRRVGPLRVLEEEARA